MIKKNIHYGIYITLAISVGAIYYFYHPAHYQLFPKCIFKNVTGLSCPGCGAQRATHELLHFNLKNAVAYNALLVAAIPYVLTGLLFYQTNLKDCFPKISQFLFGQRAILTVFLIVILFFIIRNL